MNYKRILTIQDISCVGQCSMTVALPILSAMGHETCILPTALLSTHTGGFGTPAVVHFDGDLDRIKGHWQENGITFDAILVGYLGSLHAVEVTGQILREMLAPGGIAIVDPAMGDHGKLYAGFDENYARAVEKLCAQADIIIPNVTEAAMLAKLPYRENLDEAYVEKLLDRPGTTILTGVGFKEGETGVMIGTGRGRTHYAHPKLGRSYHGTGDMFAAAFTGALMQRRNYVTNSGDDSPLDGRLGNEQMCGPAKEDLYCAVKTAADFVCKAIENTIDDPAHWYGVKFETALQELIVR